MVSLITTNGEITYNLETKEYTVWNETYTDTVIVTTSKQEALDNYQAYGEWLSKP